MTDQKRHDDQQRAQRAPGRDQDRNQQHMGNRDREPAQGNRSDEDRGRDRGDQNRGTPNPNSPVPNPDDQSRR